MLTQVAHALPLPRKPDIALPLRGKRADEFSGLGALGIAMSFARNMEIYAEGEPAGNVYKVISGVVRISKLLPDGQAADQRLSYRRRHVRLRGRRSA